MEEIYTSTITKTEIEEGEPLTCEGIIKAVKILETNNQLPEVIEVSSPLVFESCDLISEEDRIIMAEVMANIKRTSAVPLEWCISEPIDKGGENKMELYEVYLVDKGTSEFDIVRLVSKNRESARVKAFNTSKFADLDYDNLEITVECRASWEVNE